MPDTNEIIINLTALVSSAGLAGWLTVPFSIWLAGRVGAIDLPGKNKVHHRPVPRLGGVGILLACGLTVASYLAVTNAPARDDRNLVVVAWLLCGIMIIGFWDDIRGLRQWIKLIGEGLITLSLIFLFEVESGWTALAVWFWMLALINGYNFLDGLDGLAAGVAFVHLLALTALHLISGSGILAMVSSTLAMAILGFLRYNWPPAKIFMGDIGSLSLGFIISALSLLLVIDENFSVNAMLAVMLAASLPLGDVSLTVIRRLVNNQPLFPSDRGHFYDQMVNRGKMSKERAVWVSTLVATVVGTLGVMSLTLPRAGALALTVLGAALLIGLAWYFKISLVWETS
jgi:UDP-GlcNAc:undecaprenyl-phosphate GlcNAc-1-phosphate transferase